MVKTIFRIENPTHMNGMWYNKDGVATNTINELCPYGQAKTFPMPENLDIHRFNKKRFKIMQEALRLITA